MKIRIISLLLVMILLTSCSSSNTTNEETVAPEAYANTEVAETSASTEGANTIELVEGDWLGKAEGKFIFYVTIGKSESGEFNISQFWVPKFKVDCQGQKYETYLDRVATDIPIANDEFTIPMDNEDFFSGKFVAPDNVEGTLRWDISNIDPSCAVIESAWTGAPK